MLRCLGAILILGGTVAWGLRAAADLHSRTRLLDELAAGLQGMERELALWRPDLVTLLRKLAQEQNGRTSTMLEACALGIEKGNAFTDIWRCELEKLPLTARERSLLQGVGQVLGRYDDCGQWQAVARIRGQLEECAAQARRENGVRGRLYRLLGVTAGGFLLLTLL